MYNISMKTIIELKNGEVLQFCGDNQSFYVGNDVCHAWDFDSPEDVIDWAVETTYGEDVTGHELSEAIHEVEECFILSGLIDYSFEGYERDGYV